MKIIFSALIFVFLSVNSFAQQTDIAKALINPIVVNPAYVGSYNLLKLGYYRSYQSVGSLGGPIQNVFSFDSPILKSKSSLGAYYQNSTIGDLSQNFFNLGYSYKFQINNFNLQLGTGLRLEKHKIDYLSLQFSEETPILVGGEDKLTRLLINTGVFVYNKAFYFSLSYNNILIHSSEDVNGDRTGTFNLASGYHFLKNRLLSFCPSILYSHYDENLDYFAINLTTTIKNTIWFGLTYDTNEDIFMSAGINVWKCYGGFRMHDSIHNLYFSDSKNYTTEIFTGFYF